MTADEIGQALRAASADTGPLRERIAELEDALRAIFLAADKAGDEQEWADMVSAEMTDERRALITKPD